MVPENFKPGYCGCCDQPYGNMTHICQPKYSDSYYEAPKPKPKKKRPTPFRPPHWVTSERRHDYEVLLRARYRT